MNKILILEKYIKQSVRKALKEEEEHQRRAEKALYMVHRFPGLKKLMEDLMSPSFGRYVNNINIVAPKPTTFKVELTNGQDFTVKYIGKGNYSIKVSGKKYNPTNLGELERASQSIANILELNYAPLPKEENKSTSSQPSSKEPETFGPSASELNADLTAANNEPEVPIDTTDVSTEIPETPGS